MIPCLHPTTAGARLDLEAYLALAEAAGFSLVDWDVVDIHRRVQADGLDQVRALFRRHHVGWGGFGIPLDLFARDAQFAEQLARIDDLAATAAALGALRTMTWLWPSIDDPPVPVALRIVLRARAVADLLAPHGMRLGLEFVGPHHLRHKSYPFLHRLTDLLTLIDAVDRPNVGVLLDSYHWYTTGGDVDELYRLPVSKVVYVHINDTDRPPAEAIDNERLLPGEGRIDLRTFLAYLAQGGYDGPLSLEILRREPPTEPPLAVAQRAYANLTRLIAEARGA